MMPDRIVILAAIVVSSCGATVAKAGNIACTRKQLTMLNAMMKNGTEWDEKLA